MYYNSKHLSHPNFLGPRDRQKITKLFNPIDVTTKNLINEWQDRWSNTTKGRHLYNFFPCVRERLSKPWLEVDHCVSQFLTSHGNFKSKLFSFKLVPSPLCDCSVDGDEHEQTAHHILWECSLWQAERNVMLDNIRSVTGVVYYSDLVVNLGNFRAFKQFCHKYYWQQINITQS